MSSTPPNPLWSLTRGQRGRYALGILAMGLAVGLQFVAPHLIGGAVDILAPGPGDGDPAPNGAPGNPGGLVQWTAQTLGLTLPVTWLLLAVLGGILATGLAGACQYVAKRQASLASERIARDLRERLYGRLERLPCSFHDTAETGDLIQRCTSDVETLRVFLAAQVVEIGHAILLLVVALPALLVLDVPMTLVSLALYPVIIFFAYRFFHRIQEVFTAQDEAEGEMTTVLQENLTGIRVVRAFARQDFERERFGRKNALFRDRKRRVISLLGTYWSLSDILCLMQVGLVLLVGTHWASQGRLSVGELITFMMIEQRVIWPMRQLGRILNEAGRAIVAQGRIGEILQREVEPDGESPPQPPRGEVVFDRVSFSYDPHGTGRPALRDVSLRVSRGEVLALVGPPGSGKSTVLALLLGLYRPQTGSIRLDGRDLTELDPGELRQQVGTVLQEPFLYSKSLRENLTLGHPEAADEALVLAARMARIHASIEGFERGYDTAVGERGVTLSGGQRQRVAIARALLKDPTILVLDDALSAVDTRTESEILSALDERRAQHTTLIVTHRLASVTHADRICVLREGRVVESGGHGELMRRGGAYRRLWNVQHALEDELSADLEPRSEPSLNPPS